MNQFFNGQQDPARQGLDLRDFQKMVMISILLIESVACVFWQLFGNNQLILLLAVSFHALAFWLVSKNLSLAGLAWAGAFIAVVSASAVVYQAPLVSFLLSLMPLAAVLIFGYVEGVAAAAAAALVMLFLKSNHPALLGGDEVLYGVMGGGLIAFIFGGVFRYWFLDTLKIFYGNYLFANQQVEEAREERVELKQVQEDVLHANRELARLTRQLKVASQAAEEARRAKETFVATVSHELRTPLNMIIGFSEVIAQSPHVYGTRLPPMLLADIASIQRNSQHLLELVNDVLDLSQVDMGNLSISRSRCAMETIIAEAFEVIRPLFISKGLFLDSEVQKDLCEVVCDQTRIREVIINLLSNAGRFTEKGGVHIRVWSAAEEVLVAVQDTGPGISAADHERLFEPFQQLDDSIRRKHGGSGLGLAISKRFVEMHGGRMWLESAVGEGTTFYFSLPVLFEAPQPGSLASRWINPQAVVEARQRPFKAPVNSLVPRCVVIEEGEIASHLFERYLGNVEVVVVDSAAAALACLNDSPAQLLVINHADAGALEGELRASQGLPFGLPIITFWLPGSADMATSLHAQRYLIKPVSKDVLVQVVEECGAPVKTILLVDDNPEVLQLFGRILSSTHKKYTVLRALDGEQALAMLRERRPDLMILDLIMPGFSGFEVLEEKAADPLIRDIPTVVISAQDPTGVQKINGQLTLSRQDGFSPKEMLELIQASGFLGN
jgi:signal transduction histidine kinase/CheY-like chemotaxis protein